MARRLRLTRLDSIGIVDRGANQSADIMLWKRDTGGEMAEEKKSAEVQKALAELTALLQKSGYAMATDAASRYAVAANSDADIDELMTLIAQLLEKSGYAMATDRVPSRYAVAADAASRYAVAADRAPIMKRLVATLRKRFGWTEARATEIAAEIATDEGGGMDAEVAKRLEVVEKRATDAEAEAKEVRKRAEEAEARVAKMEDDNRRALYITKAAALKNLPGVTGDDTGSLFAEIAKAVGPEKFAKLEQVLRAADEVAATAKIYAEVGAAAPAGSVTAQVETLAADVRKADPSLSQQAARGKVYKDRPELMAQVEAEDRERHRR